MVQIILCVCMCVCQRERGRMGVGGQRQLGFEAPILPIREGSGTPLQYFCPENPMDGRAW